MRIFLSFLVFTAFLTNFVFAFPTFDLESESFQPQETLIGSIDGVTSEISKENIRLYQNRRELTVDKEIFDYQGKYYFYIILPAEGDYRLEIRNLIYSYNGTTGQTDFIKNISVKKEMLSSNKTEILGIRPGVIKSSSVNASTYLTNFGTSNISVEYLEKKIDLYPGEIKKINIILENNLQILTIKSYKDFYVPFIYPDYVSNITNQTNASVNQTTINFSVPLDINITSTVDVLREFILREPKQKINVTLINLGESLFNLSLNSEYNLIELEENTIDKFEENSLKEISFYLIENKLENYNDSLILSHNGSEIFKLPVEIYLFDDINQSQQYQSSLPAEQKTCNEVGGKICASNENCEGDYTYLGGLCCFGTCEKIETDKTSPGKLFAGIVILLAVGIISYYLYKKIKNVKRKNPDKKIEELSESKDK